MPQKQCRPRVRLTMTSCLHLSNHHVLNGADPQVILMRNIKLLNDFHTGLDSRIVICLGHKIKEFARNSANVASRAKQIRVR
ncbi:hypothetical protein TNCT_622221 [Trichonephila clavata]|uniref:Uncharacterized protein n=1 Tax=Trichonephila clavata TaxID=2740835 RepID=A0A8X6KNJ1_TRICU|nr:hypothetical protein TNCT_622221 [Trichonephila clavata]